MWISSATAQRFAAAARHSGARFAACCAVVALMGASSSVLAQRRIDAGDRVELREGEGLIAMVFDTDAWTHGVRFRKVGNTLSVPLRLGDTRSMELFAAPAGEYEWERVLIPAAGGRVYFDLTDKPKYRFDVRAGRINYPGDLVYRHGGKNSASIHALNRSLPVLDWLRKDHRGAFDRYEFAWTGKYPDPFPALYKQAVGASKAKAEELNAGLAPPKPTALPIDPLVMWTLPRVRDSSLSPDGALIVLELNAKIDHTVLELIDLANGSSQSLGTFDGGVGMLQWKDHDTLLVGTPSAVGEGLRIFHVGAATGKGRKVVALNGPSSGRVVDLLPGKPDRILYESIDPDGHHVVHELGLANQDAAGAFRKNQTRNRLNKGVEDDFKWFADGNGRLRAAMAQRGEEIVLMHGDGRKFRQVLKYEDDAGFQPLRLSRDGERFYGFDDTGRGQRDLVEFDAARGQVTKTLFTKPGIDVDSVEYGPGGEPIGVSYYLDGRRVSEYFEKSSAQVDAVLARSFPGRTAVPLQKSLDGTRMLLWVDGSHLPPQLYFLDTAKKQAQLLDEYFPKLASKRFPRTLLLKVSSGLPAPIDAFLTLPEGAGKHPLVVMPHGGPIGIADRLHFDREVQFITSLRYAVLQVNFRGSDGYGRAFREAGEGQFGKGIEDDIDAAIDAAIAAHPVDADRMCVLGTSYGGYSALVSAIRWPGRFRCAVSISGVTDRMLLFTASDTALSKAGIEALTRLMGDPRTDQANARSVSPLYEYQKLDTPVMLVHGRLDQRVDFEHARRLVRMLNLEGRTPVVQAFADEGHGIAAPGSQALAWNGIAGFLQKHLGTSTGSSEGSGAR